MPPPHLIPDKFFQINSLKKLKTWVCTSVSSICPAPHETVGQLLCPTQSRPGAMQTDVKAGSSEIQDHPQFEVIMSTWNPVLK